MKKLILTVFAIAMLVSMYPAQGKAEGTPATMNTTTASSAEMAETQAMIARLNEIKAMDIKSLSPEQKKQLRHEVKDIKKHIKEVTGIWLSTGAIILIVILLLLLL